MRRRTAVVIVAAAFAVAGSVAAGVAGFPRDPMARMSSRPVELPGDLEPFVFNACMPHADLATLGSSGTFSIGLDQNGAFRVRIADAGFWSVQVGRGGARVTPDADVQDLASAIASASRAAAIGQQLYACMKEYRFSSPSAVPRTGSQLLQLYKYDVAVLWPCLTGLGLDPGAPPTRQDFANRFTAQNVSPYRLMAVKPEQLRILVAAARLCPEQPAYVRSGST
ncbi:MAG TPA: hypothetical protein VGM70_11180 [Pseudolysinimonas sp.]|jgi:hypothetical protein